MRREYDKLLTRMEDMARRSKKQQQDQVSGFEQAIMGLGKMAAAYGLVERGIAMANGELQRQYDLQQKLATRAMATAGSQADIARNMAAGTTPEQMQAFVGELRKINKEAAFGNIDELQAAAASVLSATGGDEQLTLQMLRAGAQIFRDKPTDLATFAGGMGDVAGAAGISGEEAAALMVAMQGQSRMTQLAASKHAVVAVKSGMSHMGDLPRIQAAEEIMGLFAGLTVASGDAEGAETKTSTITLLKKLAELGGEGSTQERLDRVRARIAGGDLKLQEVLSGFGTAQSGVIQDLLLGRGEATDKVAATLGTVRGSVEKFRGLTTLLRTGTPELESFTAAAESRATDEGLEGDPTSRLAALRAEIRAEYQAARQKMRTTTLSGMAEPIWFFDAVDEMTRLDPGRMALNRIEALRRSQADIEGSPTAAADNKVIEQAISNLQKFLERAMTFNAKARSATAESAAHTERN
jgi:hypothetical protein